MIFAPFFAIALTLALMGLMSWGLISAVRKVSRATPEGVRVPATIAASFIAVVIAYYGVVICLAIGNGVLHGLTDPI